MLLISPEFTLKVPALCSFGALGQGHISYGFNLPFLFQEDEEGEDEEGEEDDGEEGEEEDGEEEGEGDE